jgi:hypothetical protein
MRLAKTIVFQSRVREGEPAIAFAGGISTYGALAKAVESAVAAVKALALPPSAVVMLDIRNPLHHTAMILALALLGVPSASAGSSFLASASGFLPDVFLTDKSDLASDHIRLLQVDDGWFAADPQRQPDYAALLALPGFTAPDDIVRYVYSSGTPNASPSPKNASRSGSPTPTSC